MLVETSKITVAEIPHLLAECAIERKVLVTTHVPKRCSCVIGSATGQMKAASTPVALRRPAQHRSCRKTQRVLGSDVRLVFGSRARCHARVGRLE
ncbi:hypothetical protein [Jiangella alba]|uniref:hypothetical protein n=1 Tax=Jiangella alba TaxID=561176 RepID=UPI00114CC763|nr:hypothetical protein [Jiangella alba]